jgi:hypothetical protein
MRKTLPSYGDRIESSYFLNCQTNAKLVSKGRIKIIMIWNNNDMKQLVI